MVAPRLTTPARCPFVSPISDSFNAAFLGLPYGVFAIAIFLATAVTGILHAATEAPGLTVGNRARLRALTRLVGLTVVWGIVASATISLLLPSPWS